MLKIQTGEFRGRRLQVDAGVRPTVGQVREALFSIWRDRVEGARMLDLFAGSGSVGLEALSRGARHVHFVEKAPRPLGTIERNARSVEAEDRVTIVRGTLPKALEAEDGKIDGEFDLIFADPPYIYERYPELLERAAAYLAEGGELVVEHSSRCELPQSAGPLKLSDERHYGESILSFYRR